MNQVKLYLFNLRDFIARNFFVSINALVYNHEIYFLDKYLKIIYIFLRLVPFGLLQVIFNLLNIQIIYKLDNIYNITNIKQNHILPIITSIIIESNDLYTTSDINKNNSYNLTSKIKYYNSSIPIYFLLKNNNIKNCNNIKIKYFNKGKIIEKNINDINDINKLLIYNLI